MGYDDNAILLSYPLKARGNFMKQKRSFTVVELIVVIIIIGILASLAIPQYITVVERGKVAAAKAKLDIIRKTEAIYHTIDGSYTSDDDDLATEVPEVSGIFSSTSDNDPDWNYGISIVAANNTFTVTATRSNSNYKDNTVTIDEKGVIAGDHPLR